MKKNEVDLGVMIEHAVARGLPNSQLRFEFLKKVAAGFYHSNSSVSLGQLSEIEVRAVYP